MNASQFRRISSDMAKRYGRMERGDEGYYAHILFALEGNSVKIHRLNPSTKDYDLEGAIYLLLHKINGYIEGHEVDVSDFETDDNKLYFDALSHACDPFYNKDIMESLHQITSGFPEDPYNVNDDEKAMVEDYFELPVLCLLRIIDTIVKMSKYGSEGYFEFMDYFIGAKIPHDSKMDFAVQIPAIMVDPNKVDMDEIEKLSKDKS